VPLPLEAAACSTSGQPDPVINNVSTTGEKEKNFIVLPFATFRCLDNCATPHLDTVTHRPAPSDTETIRPTNVFILRQSDPCGVGQSDHTQTAQFEPLEVGLNVGCDNLTHVQSDPFSASLGRLGDSSGDDTQMAMLKNGTAPPERTSPTHGSVGRKLELT
jgi:hypothetical protein